MIKKLRFKFILYSVLSVFALLVLILSTINIVNFNMVASDADNITQMIADHDGGFEPNKEREPRPGSMGPDSPDTPMSTRYFTVRLSKNEDIAYELIHYNISALSKETCLKWAEELSKNKAKTGWKDFSYRYRLYDDKNNKDVSYVTVIDQGRELLPSLRVLIASVIGGVSGTLITFLAILLVSKKFIKPIEDTYHKQQRFVADASYELKTPLTIISMNNEILELEQGENEECKAISKEIKHLNKVLDNLANLALLDGTLPEKINKNNFVISDSVNQIAEKYISSFNKLHKKLDVNIVPDLVYKGDKDMIMQLIDILLDNALKYSTSEASLDLRREDERIIIIQTNDRKDIKDGPLDIVFEKFYRFEADRNSKVDGSGLGLSIAKDIVNLHKGRIYAKGNEGKFIIKVEL